VASHGCEGTYRLEDGRVAVGTSTGASENAAKQNAMDQAQGSIDFSVSMALIGETCDDPCENPPWYRVTKATIDNYAEQKSGIIFGYAYILWALDIDCRKPRPATKPALGKHGKLYFLTLAKKLRTRLKRDRAKTLRTIREVTRGKQSSRVAW